MPTPSTDAVRTSVAGAAASQPQPSNAAAANFLPGFNPLLPQANLGNIGVSGANVLGAQPGVANPDAAHDPALELASALSRVMLTGNPLAQQNLLANMSANMSMSTCLQQMHQNLLATAAIQQSILQATGGASLLSLTDQQQALRNVGLLPPLSQTTTQATSSAVHSAVTASGSAPVNAGRAGPGGGQSASQADSTFARSFHESAHPQNFGLYLPPR